MTIAKTVPYSGEYPHRIHRPKKNRNGKGAYYNQIFGGKLPYEKRLLEIEEKELEEMIKEVGD